MADWILENLGPDVPLHLTAFHPDFKLRDKPRTPPETLHRAGAIRREAPDCTTFMKAISFPMARPPAARTAAAF